ncbi:hypothetical protein OGATHE_004763 [Ogataea polymorpha]|uniref:Uncharacterized protein n=1 Tax=Ogataea polymorpha TaxID=460523 RepID=A0A9P8P112_9ASCO|nr:hypothetical protein OGATHE_004763 [Ogataea polymorpha]
MLTSLLITCSSFETCDFDTVLLVATAIDASMFSKLMFRLMSLCFKLLSLAHSSFDLLRPIGSSTNLTSSLNCDINFSSSLVSCLFNESISCLSPRFTKFELMLLRRILDLRICSICKLDLFKLPPNKEVPPVVAVLDPVLPPNENPPPVDPLWLFVLKRLVPVVDCALLLLPNKLWPVPELFVLPKRPPCVLGAAVPVLVLEVFPNRKPVFPAEPVAPEAAFCAVFPPNEKPPVLPNPVDALFPNENPPPALPVLLLVLALLFPNENPPLGAEDCPPKLNPDMGVYNILSTFFPGARCLVNSAVH